MKVFYFSGYTRFFPVNKQKTGNKGLLNQNRNHFPHSISPLQSSLFPVVFSKDCFNTDPLPENILHSNTCTGWILR